MILDRFGNEVPIVKVRESIGFVRQQLIDDTKHDVNAPTPPRVHAILLGDQIDDPVIA